MECAELHPSGGSNATVSEEDAKNSPSFNTQFQQQETSPPSPEDKKFLVPVLNGTSSAPGSADNRTILSGCDPLPAWSAVIHRPAEDSEPDELPSTVDMDAIKGSPPTPKVPYESNEPWNMSGDRDVSDSSDDESDDDSSGSGSGDSGSDADGSVSSSCSWTDDEGSSGGRDDSSDDSCSSSSSSSASSCSSASRSSTATPQQTFSIRETNFEQGGLKLKIAAMNVRPSDDGSTKTSSSFGVPKEVVSVTPVPKTTAATITPQTPTPDKKAQIASPSISRLRPRRKEEPVKGATSGSSQGQRSGSKREPQSHAAGPSSSAVSRSERGNGQPGGEAAISQLAQELSGDALQEINQEDLAAILPDVSTPEGPNEDVAGPPFDGFEDVSSLSGKAEIGTAAIVAASSVVTSQPQPEAESSSEDMELLPEQVVSAAIQRIHLDEDTASCTEGAEPSLTRSRERAESFSSQDGEDEASDVETKSPRTSARVYSSRLLQQFEQKTAMLSQGDKNAAKSGTESGSTCIGNENTKQQTKESKSSPNSKNRRPRGRPPKNPVVESEETAVVNKSCSIELDAFMPLDCCNVSNVSPDSGIQSVAGSPVHQSCSPASNHASHASPSHSALPLSTSPAPMRQSSPPPKAASPIPLQSETKRRPGRPSIHQKQKRGPGRPKGSVGKKISTSQTTNLNSSIDSRPERGTLETELPGYIPHMTPLSTSPSASQPAKRGPGRPKKVTGSSECSTQVSPQLNNTNKKTNISGKGEITGKNASPEVHSVTNKPPDSFLSRRAKKEHALKTKNKDGKNKIGKRCKTKFGIDKRKSRKGLPTGRKRWRTNNIKALTVPFHLANDAALTVAVSQMNHKFSSKLPISMRKRSSHSMQTYHAGNHKIQQLRKGHKIFTHHKGRDQLGHGKRKLLKSSSHILAQNKQKKKKKKSEQSPKQQDDPEFLNALDDLMSSLRKCSISRALTLPAPGDGRLPSIFRVRRLLKRRKGSERSKASDRESEGEATNVVPPKSPHQASKEKSKRKNKKNAVEPPKRAEPNEQRLPLKKRHYHLSNQQQPPSSDITELERTPTTPPTPAAPSSSYTKSSPPITASTQTPLRSEKAQSSSRISRNSIDEAIEACISRYSTTKSSTSHTQGTTEKAAEIATPKKRHKTEEKAAEQEKPPTSLALNSKSQTPPSVPPKRSAAVRACNTSKNSENIKDINLPSAETNKESPVKVEVKTEVLEPKQSSIEVSKKSKKKKNIKDVKIQLPKLSENDAILKKAVASVKKKVKRRKTINRTGFPIKRKKKPKSQPEQSNRTNTNVSGSTSNKNNTENERKPKHETSSKETNTEVSKSGRIAASKRKHESSVTEDVSLPAHQNISKRLRGCKDDDASSTTDELPLMAILSDSLYPADAPSGDESSKSGKKKQPPRWRKKYLVAGLFSDYYKEDEPKKSSSSGEATVSKSRSFVYKPEEHIHGLLPPPYHCGKYLRQRKVDFQLPHDLWWLHVNNQLPGRDSVPSWNYKKIRTNVYYDVKPPYDNEAQACNCTLPQKPSQLGCGDDCINRLVYTECSTQLCPCKERCANQKVQKHDWAPGIEKFMTKDKGWGVRTKKSIKNGDFILEYVGEVVSEKEFKNRMASRYSHDTHHYCLHLDGGLVIDGHRMGGDGRFVNHSCEPNCEMQKWSVNGLFRMALFALRDIEPGEELGYDYNFSLFNPAEGQPCKCGSTQCRGVIGGKSQRVTLSTNEDKSGLNGDKKGRLKQNSRKSKFKQKKFSKLDSNSLKHQIFTPMKPMSHQQRCFAQMHHCFLLRNLEKVKRLRDRLKLHAAGQQETLPPGSANYGRPAVITTKASDVFLAQLNALSTPRSMRTRRLAQAEDNPELTRVARLAYVFKDLYQLVCAAKDEKGDLLAAPFVMLPPKRKVPLYYEKIQEPIDLSMLEKNITSGSYKSVEAFDEDIFRLFNNNVRFYGRTSELGIAAARLRKVYCDAKNSFQSQLDDIHGECVPPPCSSEKTPTNVGRVGIASSSGTNSSVNKEKDEEEEVIRCICGLYMDEGLMIQCERCLVWQHADCVQADSSVDHYLCELCVPRQVNRDILMNPRPEYAQPGETHYISLMREDLQLRQGDTVYVLRDIVREDIDDPSLPPQKHTYKTLTNGKPEDCDIFRIERLYTDEKGSRFAFGHHYLRPHETYHEPTRRFFPNEVMRVPLYEVVPFDLVLGQCWVLDLPTFCKGRPIGAKEEHVYVCEFRVDKTAHLFARLAPRTAKQSVAQLCMKPYAFEVFHTRLKPQRTYTPHGGTSVTPRPRSKSRPHGEDDACSSKSDASKTHPQTKQPVRATITQQPPGVKRAKQKQRLNSVLLHLLDKQQCKQPLDVSYLLEPNRRQRKKPANLLAS